MASLFTIANLAGWHIMSFYVAKKNANISLRSNASHPPSLAFPLSVLSAILSFVRESHSM